MAEDGAGSNTIIESRKGQAFPQLSADEIDRLRRFGAVRHYGDGERLFAAGEPGPGMFVVLKGRVAVTRPDGLGHEVPVINQGVGEFLAEIGQLSGRPAFVDGHARGMSRRCCCRRRGCVRRWWRRPSSARRSCARWCSGASVSSSRAPACS